MTNNNNNNDEGLWGAAGICAGSAAVLVVGTAAFAFWSQRRPTTSTNDLDGVTVCITGANVGIGRAVAENLSQRGARILMGCRNMEQAKEVCSRIGNHKCHAYKVDLSDFSSVEAFSKSVADDTSRTGLHILINNAGAMIREQDRDAGGGWDRSMAVNHLGWVQLTRNLLPVLEKTAAETATTSSSTPRPIRIVNVGSLLEKSANLPSADPSNNNNDARCWDQWLKESPVQPPYSPFKAYANAKFAMTAATFHWAKLLLLQNNNNNNNSSSQPSQPPPPIQMVLVSPGMVNTSLPRFMPWWKRTLSYPFRALLLKGPQQAAETVAFVATCSTTTTAAGGGGVIQPGKYYRCCSKNNNSEVVEEIQNTERCSEAAKDQDIGQQVLEATFRVLERRKEQQQQQQQQA